MATGWNTFPVELTGGLIQDLPQLQQGIKAPGSARRLTNFEASVKGGYRRINGFSKFSESIVPPYGDPRVQGGSQTGTTLNIANIFVAPSPGDTFTIDGVSGTYTIDTGGVSYSSAGKSATLTLTTSLASSPADKAAITFNDTTKKIEGLNLWQGNCYAVRDGAVWYSTGTTWTLCGPPNYGTLTVNGGSQTGTSLSIQGITNDSYGPEVGDTFTIDGVNLIYTITAVGTITSGNVTLTITPALDSSPANGAAITELNTDLGVGDTDSKYRFQRFNFDGNVKTAFTNNVNYPHIINADNTIDRVWGSTDVATASFVVEHKDSLFYADGDLVTFTEPFDEVGFDTGQGAGSIRVDDDVTGMIVFRDQLFIFTKRSIHVLRGDSSSDYQLDDVSNEVGCIQPDTIQEVGGDVMFMGPDGFRFLGATDRIGDFRFANASKAIVDLVDTFEDTHTNFCSAVLTEKNQVRFFGHNDSQTRDSSEGFIGVQFYAQEAYSFQWSQTLGIKAYRATTGIYLGQETMVHSQNLGYVYRQESGSSFDGEDIEAAFYTPWYTMEDPNMRKTHYKLQTYMDLDAPVTGTISPRLNFNESGVIQPSTKTIDTTGAGFSVFGEAIFGTSTFAGGDPPKSIIKTNVEGSFFAVSYQYEFIGTDNPFIIDTLTVDYKLNDKK